MQYDKQFIIEALGINELPAEEKERIVIEATMRIGTALVGGLSDQQYTEYKAIVDDDAAVIDAWLSQNVPDYKELPAYQEIESGYEADPEKNRPEKLFATIAWIEKTVPDIQDRINQTLAAYKQELAA